MLWTILHLMREYTLDDVMFRNKMLLSVACMQVLHTLSCRSRKMIRLRRDSNWIKKKCLRTPYAYNMNRAILQSVSGNLFYLPSFEKKRKKKTQSRCMILLLYKNLFQIGAIRNQREVCYYDRIIVIWF